MAAILVLAACVAGGWWALGTLREPEPEPLPEERYEPIDADVVAAWEAAGAEYGSIRIDERGITAWQPQSEEPGAGALAGFRFQPLPAGKLSGLPEPRVPFGLFLQGSMVTDQHAEEIARFEHLRILGLAINQLTDQGVAELARAERLRSLDLTRNPITSASLKQIARVRHLQTLDLNQTQVDDEGAAQLAGLKNLWMLDLTATRITDKGLKYVGRLPRLRMLYLTGLSGVTDAGIAQLKGCAELEFLNLAGTRVTDKSLKYVARLPGLRVLNLNGLSGVTDAGIAQLEGCAELEFLSVDSTGITGEGLAYLAGPAKLATLRAGNINWSDAGLDALGRLTSLRSLQLVGRLGEGRLEKLSGLTNLESLSLFHCGVNDEDLKILRGMKNLRELDLQWNPEVTDETLRHLAELKNLRQLYIANTGASFEGLVKLREALPELREGEE